MTSIQLKDLLTQIVGGLGTVEDIAAGLDPALKPLVLIGKAVEAQIPGIAATVMNWIQGNPPTDAELEDFYKKLAVLSDPNNP